MMNNNSNLNNYHQLNNNPSSVKSINANASIGPYCNQQNHFIEERRDGIFRKVRGILNKITPETFDKLSKELVNVGLDSPRTLRGVIYLLFDKALKDLKYSSLYAKLCRELSEKAPNFETDPSGPNTFCKILISKCEDEFERRRKATEDFDGKNELSDEEFELKAIAKQKMLGNIKFICELGKKRLLQEEILHECIRGLLSKKKERPIPDQAQDLECLCQIMRTIGGLLDGQASRNLMNQYFERIEMFSKKPELPSRIRFMLSDVIDLRNNNWRPRPFQREDNVPQPLSKLREEAGYDPNVAKAIDKFGNSRSLIGISDLSKLHGNKMSMFLDDEPSFTTTTDFHWGPTILPFDQSFDAFSSSTREVKSAMNVVTKKISPANATGLTQSLVKPSLIHHNDSLPELSSARYERQHPTNLATEGKRVDPIRRFNEYGLNFGVDRKAVNEPINVNTPRHDRDPFSIANFRNKLPNVINSPPRVLRQESHSPAPSRRLPDKSKLSNFNSGGNISPPNRFYRRPPEMNQPFNPPQQQAPPNPLVGPNHTQVNLKPPMQPRPIILDNRDEKVMRPDPNEFEPRYNRFSNNNSYRQARIDRPPFRDSHNFDRPHMSESEMNLNWRTGIKPVEQPPNMVQTAIVHDQNRIVSQPRQQVNRVEQNTEVSKTTGTRNVKPVQMNRIIPIEPTLERREHRRPYAAPQSNDQDRPLHRHADGGGYHQERGGYRSPQRQPFNRNQPHDGGIEKPGWRKFQEFHPPNLKEQQTAPILSPILSKPLTRITETNFSLRPSHNLAGRSITSQALSDRPTSQSNKVATGGDITSKEDACSNDNTSRSKFITDNPSASESNRISSESNRTITSQNGSPIKSAAKELHVKKFESVILELTDEAQMNLNRIIGKIKDLKIPKCYQQDCLASAIKQFISKSEEDRERVRKLLVLLIPSIFESSVLVEAFKLIFKQLHALEIEIPRVKSIVAEFLSCAVLNGLICLEEIGNILSGGKHHPLFLLFLQKMNQSAGQTWLSEKFIASKINLMDMLPEIDRSKGRLASILKDRCLGFLDPVLTIEPDLWEQMKERDSSPAAIYRWIKDNLDPTIQGSPSFAHVLMSCLLKHIFEVVSEKCKTTDSKDESEGSQSSKSSPSSSSAQSSNDLEKEMLNKYQQILQAILKDKQMQLATLYALQSFHHNLDFPKGALLRWFHMMYDMNIVDDDVFFIWKEEINDEVPGKGQALFQVNTWLNWLAEDDSEEEEEV